MAKDKKPRGLGRSSGIVAATAASDDKKDATARFNPLGNKDKSAKGKAQAIDADQSQNQDNDEVMSEPAALSATDGDVVDSAPETAQLAIKSGQNSEGDELSELRQTYEAAQKQFAESGTQEYLRGTIHECDRMVRNCKEAVYPSSEFHYIYASALHDFSLVGAEPEEVNGFVEMADMYVKHAIELLEKEGEKEREWIWMFYLVAGKVNLQKADALFEEQENAKSKKQFQRLGNQIDSTLQEATSFLEKGFQLLPDGQEKFAVKIYFRKEQSIEKVDVKEHERVSAAANVALHADRFEEYERRKKWNTWALETYRQVTEDTPENFEAWQGIATSMHSIVGWWADQADEEEEDDEDEEEEEPEDEDEYSLPVYSTERGQMSLQAVDAIKKAIALARKSDALTSDLLTQGAECHLNLVNIAVGDKAASEQSKQAVALIKEAIASFPDPALEERYSEVLQEFEEITSNE